MRSRRETAARKTADRGLATPLDASPGASTLVVDASLGETTREALGRAARDVVDGWEYLVHGAISPSDIRATVAALCQAIAAALRGDDVVVSGYQAYVPARRVLEVLRRTFLAHAERDAPISDPHDVLRVAMALEQVQTVLDDDAAHRFASRLSGADAQQLVVEMAHDMRSPLGSILILAERLRYGSGSGLTPVQERQIGLVYSAAFGLSSMASDVIELARGGTTLIDQPAMAFSISDVLQGILDILRPMAEEKNIQMHASGPTADVRVGYQAALNRVLLNLTTNALKFTNAGSVHVVCKQLDRTRIEFSVKDTGRGIPGHVLTNLFEAFRQRQIPGDYAFSSAGLGLSICKQLVAAMGGELGVETELENGTRFFFVVDLPMPTRR